MAVDLASGACHTTGIRHQPMIHTMKSSALRSKSPIATQTCPHACKVLMTRIEPIATIKALASTLSRIKQSAQVVVRSEYADYAQHANCTVCMLEIILYIDVVLMK